MWFTRRLALKLLAPTVLVSLILVGACLLGTLYLNYVHVNASAVLTENVQSTQAAARLETTTKELLRLLRGDHSDGRNLEEQVWEQNRTARSILDEAQRLANLERESILVARIGTGLTDYFHRWEQRPGVPEAQRKRFDGDLADLLEREVLLPCIELRKFNTGQIQESDQENQRIIERIQWGMIAVAVGGPLSGLLLGYAVARSLYRSIYQLSVRIRDAAGKLSRELGSVTLEEKGDLADLHQQMQGVLREIGRVVDELEQREREVLRAEHLAAVGQVAAGVAHELRNPLTSIKMLVQTWLEEGPGAGLPAEELAIIEREIRRIEQRLQTFLDFARPPHCERREADLVEVVRRAAALVEGRARRQRVALELNHPPQPVPLKIDPEQVHQVLVNLLLNALDVLPHGGTVGVEVESVPAGDNVHDAARVVEVRVRDSGPGILPHISGRLFEPFVSSKESGLGLGLSICKRLVEAHGGTIRGETGRRGGAVFTFTLPLEEAHAVAVGGG